MYVLLQLSLPKYKSMAAIPKALFYIFDDDLDVYWLARGFFICVEKFRKEIPKLIECTVACLEKEDQQLYR
jgi:hypothetical protein